MVRPLSLAQHTLYADLLELGAAGLFDPEFPENGSVTIRPGRPGTAASEGYAYYHGYRSPAGSADRPQRYCHYVGKASDPGIAARIARFHAIKATRAERATTVRALVGAGLPRPDPLTGRIVEALARAGLFPDHAVLLGEAADQTYDGVLGVRLPRRASGSADGMRPEVTVALRDPAKIAHLLDGLRTVDPSFSAMAEDPNVPAARRFETASRARVDVLVADGDTRENGDPIGLLIDRPGQAILLHGPGIPVSVPAAERRAVHALIAQGVGPVGRGLAERDPGRAADLIEALDMAGREHGLTQALTEAWQRHPSWRSGLHSAIRSLPWPYRALFPRLDAELVSRQTAISCAVSIHR
ncbi:GSU2403 family nucleotidyltransferase fold protein [Methylobacterium sp. 092160098-2]|jgi:hypothetical protein|uniref:GSU2403 family nucleotidyltransferase fold protein n=1 Tax=Methylobacterium sp. 092160098-2 TaxID=3025129 RepID=UPI002381CD3A|nr:GSU2403 family nucleotidyltransferase fold protein [Methylobacterium sp. 092160098-2]MDE4914741.1 GSU2403 family nucleotidyltransferase fold protein [Methylobacterium sp. 092160098-2]